MRSRQPPATTRASSSPATSSAKATRSWAQTPASSWRPPAWAERIPALVEAMAFGNCVVTNNTDENLETIGDAGFAYDGRIGAPDLIRALAKLLTDPDLVDRLRATRPTPRTDRLHLGSRHRRIRATLPLPSQPTPAGTTSRPANLRKT